MWHSTQLTRACADTAWARGSSGWTWWQELVQNALLFVYSQKTMPPAPRTASAIPATTSVVTVPIISVRRPNLIFIVDFLSSFRCLGRRRPAPFARRIGMRKGGPRAVRPVDPRRRRRAGRRHASGY